jgi:hypothetical protein
MHVLEIMNLKEAPLKCLNYFEIYKKLWLDQGSIRDNILYVIEKLENN